MPHVCLVGMSGFRVRDREMGALGMALPGLAARAAAVGALPSLGLLTLAGMTPGDWSVSYHEPTGVNDGLIDELVSHRPRLVAVSALTPSIDEAYRLCGSMRAQGIATVIGGLHATACPEEAADRADGVVVGDGEPVWLEVLRDARAGRLRGVYRSEAAFDLSRSPMPRFDLLGTKDRPRFTVQTARGCPLACEFCGASRLLGGFREKPAERVAAELSEITRMKPRACVELADDNTFAGRRDAGELLEVLGRSGVRFFTEADWRFGERPEIVERLAEAGCVQVLVGIESLRDEYGGMGGKAASMRRMMDAVRHIQDGGVSVIGCFVVGGDSETTESMCELGAWLADAPFADVQITVQTPFPGTGLRRRLEREGRLLPERGWESCTLFDVAYRPARMSVKELERSFHKLVAFVFGSALASRRAGIRQEVWARRPR